MPNAYREYYNFSSDCSNWINDEEQALGERLRLREEKIKASGGTGGTIDKLILEKIKKSQSAIKELKDTACGR